MQGSSQMKEGKNCVINFHGDKVSTFGRSEIFFSQRSTSALKIELPFTNERRGKKML